MGGITGCVHFKGEGIPQSDFDRMTDIIAHRGPDGEGVKHLKGEGVSALLGHRRLAMQNLSAAGAQPKCNEDEAFWIVLCPPVYWAVAT